MEAPRGLSLRGRLTDARLERRILAQDRLFEAPQLRRGLESELRVQPAPAPRVDLQRVGLAPAAIQGQHEQAEQPLARRMLGDQLFELGDDERVLPRRQARVDALFQRGEAQLLEPGDLSLRERLERDIGQGRPAPQRERIVEQAPRRRLVALDARRPRGADERLETPRVDRVGLDREAIARRHRLQRRRRRHRASAAGVTRSPGGCASPPRARPVARAPQPRTRPIPDAGPACANSVNSARCLPGRHADDGSVHARLDRAEDRDLQRHGHGQHYARSHAV